MKEACLGCERRDMCPSIENINPQQEQILSNYVPLVDQILDLGCVYGLNEQKGCGVDQALGVAADRIYSGAAIAIQQYARVVNGAVN